MKGALVFLLVMLLLVSAGCTQEERDEITGQVTQLVEPVTNKIQETAMDMEHHGLKIEAAETISEAVNAAHLPTINLNEIHEYDDYVQMIENLNLAIKIVNKHVDKQFNPFSTERVAYEEFLRKVNKYSPLIDNYNELVIGSGEFDPAREESADRVLTSTAGCAIEATLITSSALHKAVFKTLGEASAHFGLLRLSHTCGPCVGAAMQSAYWGSKNFIVERGSELGRIIFKEAVD